MYDDLLGEPKPKPERGTVVIQEVEWDEENKELITTSEQEVEVEITEDGEIKPLSLYQRVMKSRGYQNE